MAKIEIKFTNGLPLEKSGYPGLNETSYVLEKGSVQKEGAMPLACDVLVEQDTPVKLRDGATIRVDVYRPVNGTDCPVVMWYAPYGKRGSFLNYDNFNHPTRMDVPTDWEDGLNSFEAPNPSYWVSHGYAVISPDPRGVGSSEGNAYAWGSQQSEDEYDLIEWAAAQEWSNGKIGLTGTSYLAMSQYAVAGIRPPHLAAIAPWEGAFDPYRDTMARGGISDLSFNNTLTATLYTKTQVEDIGLMMREHPYFDEYWEDKVPDIENAEVPAYIVASWTNAIHSSGSIEAFEKIGSKEKWLRISNTHEWTDYYNPAHVEDLRKFFDHYLKGLDNGWENTPKVRMSVLNPGHEDIVDRPEPDFPPKGQQETVFYLNRDGGKLTLSDKPQEEESLASYDVSNFDGIRFRMKMNKKTEFIGRSSLRLWVEAQGNNDMDLYAYVRKIGPDGKPLEPAVVTDRYYPGPNGQLRVSCRELDESKSTSLAPALKLTGAKKLAEGEIVPVEIPFWPFGICFEEGETMELQICPSSQIVRPEFPQLPPQPTLNKGTHIIHFGGKYDSKLRLPEIRK